MAASTMFALSVLGVCVTRVAAIQKTLNRGQVHGPQGAVCISLAAYEDPAWISFLIRNVVRFTDCSTKVTLHLNALTNYSEEDIHKWNTASARVSVNPERVAVARATGSILHAHVLNTLHMQELWGDECSYWVLQASNMLWIKPGLESYITEFHISGMHQRAFGDCSGFCAQQGWSDSERVWEEPEGTFVPMSLMRSFTKEYMSWLRTLTDPYAEHLHKPGAKEEDWLQTYTCVHEGNDPIPGPTACKRLGKGYRLDVAAVKEIIEGSVFEEDRQRFKSYYEGHDAFINRTSARSMGPFSVKVISEGGASATRNPNSDLTKWLDLAKKPYKDPVIKYIMDLTDTPTPTLNEYNSC